MNKDDGGLASSRDAIPVINSSTRPLDPLVVLFNLFGGPSPLAKRDIGSGRSVGGSGFDRAGNEALGNADRRGFDKGGGDGGQGNGDGGGYGLGEQHFLKFCLGIWRGCLEERECREGWEEGSRKVALAEVGGACDKEKRKMLWDVELLL